MPLQQAPTEGPQSGRPADNGEPITVNFSMEISRNIVQTPSDEAVRTLQNEYGNDIVGAVDKYIDSKLHPLVSDPAAISPGDTLHGEDVTGDEAREEVCERDQYWDRTKRRWVMKRPTKSGARQKYDRFVLFVRRVYTEKMVFDRTEVLVKGPAARRVLQNIFRGADGFSLPEDGEFELSDHRYLFWAKPALELLFRYCEEPAALFEFAAVSKFIRHEWGATQAELDALLPHTIGFNHLWAIFPPDCLLVTKDALGTECIWRARTCKVSRTREGAIVFQIDAVFIEWDGEVFGEAKASLQIPQFAGATEIATLPSYPLKYHPDRDELLARVQARGEAKLEFCKRGFQIREYQAVGLYKGKTYSFNGRVMIDPLQMRRANNVDDNDVPRLSKRRRRSYVRLPFNASEHEERRLAHEILARPTRTSTDDFDGSGQFSPYELTGESLLILSGLVYGYSLGSCRWGAFSVGELKKVRWNENLLDSLVMKESLRDTVYGLVKSHNTDFIHFDDFVHGKGKGLLGLLYGPPGSGKTLTAEAIAETGHMPLYVISSGALGHEPDSVYSALVNILKLAAHWRAVLLLDEADVFLTRRTLTDLKQNAIVSVFLRELEYYEGILLLTTNQIAKIDEAFLSPDTPQLLLWWLIGRKAFTSLA